MILKNQNKSVTSNKSFFVCLFLKQILKIVHLDNPTQTTTRHCMVDRLILELLLNKLLILLLKYTMFTPSQYNCRKECKLYLKTRLKMTTKMNLDEGESTSAPHWYRTWFKHVGPHDLWWISQSFSDFKATEVNSCVTMT